MFQEIYATSGIEMYEFIKSNIKHFKTDKFRVIVCLVSYILAVFHAWQYFSSGFKYQCLIRIVSSLLIIPLAIFLGRKAVYYLLIAFSLRIAYVNPFNNYTGFFCLLMSCIIIHRNRRILLAIYALNETAALILQNCEISHIAIHLLSCFLWYILYFYVNQPTVFLNLTDSESRILDELVAGKQQKEIDFCNKNTVTKKLHNARKRNGCKTTNELLFKYRKSLEEDKFKEK